MVRYPHQTSAKIELRRAGWKYDRKSRRWTFTVGDRHFVADSLHAAMRIHRHVEQTIREKRNNPNPESET